jgi:serine/threonine-protein kinase
LALTPGTHFGPYEILSALGVGGMGEVYRARDTKLGRDVALKILPDTVAQDVDRVARFKREAQVLAALNHPHIAAIYGFEEAPSTSADHAGGTRFLVLELVEGETLADRLKRGPIPADEAIAIARQIADALAEAHEKGIIHRDLKPANVALTSNDQVKVLDFGLAKLAATTGSAVSSGLSMSPTLTTPAMTAMGTILGTAAYMAPEQAKGRDADKRSDLWAFGCVVYEMLTAKQAFQGEDVLDTLTAIMRGEPDWNALPAGTPANVRLLIELCLTKDRSQRAADIAVAQFLFGDRAKLASPTPLPTMNALPREPTWRRALPSAASLVVGSLLAGAAVWLLTRPATPRITRTTIATSGLAALTINGTDRYLALSPDGTHVVYVGNNATQLFVRAIDALEPLAIATGAGLRAPFISPDGQWVGFQDGALLRKVAISGGPPITVASIGGGGGLRGATWMPDDTIIFATASPATGLVRVSAAGGTPEVLTRPDGARGELDHLWPEFLPGGRAVLFTITSPVGGLDAAQVVVRDLRTGTNKVLVRGGSHGYYVATGHLVYVAARTLRAIPFDLTRLETHGTAVPVLPRLATTPTGAGNFAVATDGTLVYVDVPGSLAGNGQTIVWVDRTGKEEPVAAPTRAYELPRLSPDGTRMALSIADQEDDLWIGELGRATLTRLTLDPGRDWFPVWTPDGRRIVFSSTRGGVPNLWWQAADGTGAAERLTTSSNPQFVTGITPDGTAVVFVEQTPTTGRDLMQLALDGTRKVTPLLQTKFDERNGIVSPDGRWLAYESNSSGTFEIYVRPFPDVGGGQWEISTAGGAQPLWSRSGKELFYFSADGTRCACRWRRAAQSGERRHADQAPDRRSNVSGGTGTGRTHRCVARRSALPDDQNAGDRRERRAAGDHRGAALGRGTEAPRAGKIGWRSPAQRAVPGFDRAS